MITKLVKNTQVFTSESPVGSAGVVVGIPAGGAINTFLKKSSATDHDTEWGNPVQFAQIEERKALDTPGGDFVAGSWVMRDMTDIVFNEIGVAVQNSRFTLLAGKYFINAKSAVYRVENHKLRLYDFTNSSAVLYGLNMNTDSADQNMNMYAFLEGMFSISETTIFELQHICSSTKAENGMGVPSNLGTHETYSSVILWKV